MYTLKSDRLRVDISAPAVAPNTTSRFDRAGFIEEVVLDGIHRFCASEPRNLSHKSSGGRGICSEYKTEADAEARVGEYFIKPGVGLLLKETDEPYKFMNAYRIIPFEIETVQTSDTSVTFLTRPNPCGGYALSQEKRVEIAGNRLEMFVKLINEGEKTFVGEEYCHNFITINNMSLGPNYSLEFPSGKDRGSERLNEELIASGRAFTFSGPLKKALMYEMGADDFNHNAPCPGGPNTADERGAAACETGRKPFKNLEWIFKNSAEGAQARVRERLRLDRVLLWAADHMFSTESFHSLTLAPGESDEWSRTWTFETI